MRQTNLLRRKTLTLFILFGAPLLFGACGGGESNTSNVPTANAAVANASPSPAAGATPGTQAQVVNVTAEETKLDAGGSGEAAITLVIADGYHVNANPASDKYYIPTELKAEPQEGLTPGKPSYPKSVTHKFQFSDKPLAVYEGRAVIRLPLSADKSAAKGRHMLRATVRVQPCNDEACLQPRNIEATVPVTIN
jgi:Disulphide bond corrector protein DsbC